MKHIFHLKDLIDIKMFQKIQDDIADGTGMAIITVDYKGKPVTKHSKCSKFCEIIRDKNEFRELCEKCDSRGGLEAARIGKPYIYRCHGGLIDFAVPIIVEDQYLGALMAGQVLTEEENLLKLENVIQGSNAIEDNLELLEKYKEITIIPFDKIKAIAQMMFHMSNYIVGEAVLKMAQQELNEKNIRFMEAEKVQAELEKELKASQLKALESQVNPHFLFNVLNSISALALLEKAPKTQDVICNLADMLRYTLKNVNQIVNLGDAVKYVDSYLKLQKVRFGDRLKFIIDLEENLEKVKIPSMIIQPFVENSIVHGLEFKEKGGTIKIDIFDTGKYFVISICDNGTGISEDKLKLIIERKNWESTEKTSTGIGIENVRQRMDYYYGDSYSVNIESEVNLGTKVKIILPKQLK